ncbi:HdeD family acid-resistance protein [Edaphobacter aggregans]|uniref:HdeD family acid-resistance protein n=1 Tax=Edaphobacter aggregans TaxID=570835 RepID=UPI00054F82CB|nr:DUF308 domain-containing protein [Edaphobacter aggregans]
MAEDTLSGEVKKHSTWTMFMGFLIAALGLLLIAYPFAAATITAVLLGWVLILVGIAQVIFALHSHTVGKFFLKLLSAVLFAICGLVLALFPIEGVAALTGVLGTFLIVQAIVLIVIAFQVKPIDGWGWFLADGLGSLLLGFLILAKWPASSTWAIGTLIGLAVLISGITRIMIAGRIRSGAATVQRFTRPA